MKLQINITKDILKRAMMCGTKGHSEWISKNCAVALAVTDLFPKASVGVRDMGLGIGFNSNIFLPHSAIEFISRFDKLGLTPEKRLELSEFSFEIEVPNQVIDEIGLEQVYSILENHKSMQLAEAK